MQTLTSRLAIRVDDRHVIESRDGRTLTLRTTDNDGIGNPPAWPEMHETRITSLLTIGVMLDILGIKGPRPDLTEATKIVNYQFGVLVDVVRREPERPFVATFGYGHFKAQWHPPTDAKPGMWTFAQPLDPRLELSDTGYLIEKTDDLLSAAWNAIERTTLIAGTEMNCVELGDSMAMIARLLTADPHLARPGVTQ